MPAPSFKPQPILTLSSLKRHREKAEHHLTPKQVAARLYLPIKRYNALESIDPNKAEEPWLDEAVRIALILQTNVITLMGVPSLNDVDLGFDPRDDLDVWRTGCRLPLSTACRLCLRFGIPDPIDLLMPVTSKAEALRKQVWSVIATGERVPAGGGCPWCAADTAAGAPHLDTCLAEFFWGARDAPLTTIGAEPKPRRPGRRRGASMPGKGLRALRDREGVTQEAIALSIEVHPSYYARLEQTVTPLNVELAERIAALYRVTVESLYAEPAPSLSDDPTANGSTT